MKSTLKIIPDVDCEIFLDTEYVGLAGGNKVFRIELRKGTYVIEFVSSTNRKCRITENYVMASTDIEDLLRISFRESVEEKTFNREEENRILNAREIRLNSDSLCIYDKETDEIIYIDYTKAYHFQEGLASVLSETGWGFINPRGEEVIACKYTEVQSFIDGFAKVKENGKFGCINKAGSYIIPCKYDRIDNFVEGIAKVVLNGKFGYLTIYGDEIVRCKYDLASDFKVGFANVQIKDGLNYRVGLIDKSGNEIVPCKYDGFIGSPYTGVAIFKNGLATVSIKDSFGEKKYGFVNSKGVEIIPCNYQSIWEFDEIITGVKKNGKWGFIDVRGNVVVDFKYSDVNPFKNGIAAVNYGGQHSGMFLVGGKWGGVNNYGKEVIPCKYDKSDYIK